MMEAPPTVQAMHARAQQENLLPPKRTALQEILMAILAYRLSNADDMSEILRICQRIMFSEVEGVDPSQINEPRKNMVRTFHLRLDMLHSLAQRHLHPASDPTARRARYLSADASPQGGYDYLCCLEELLSRPRAWVPMPDAESGEFNPFTGFAYEIRALPRPRHR